MPIYNTATSVVANISAPDPETAMRQQRALLVAAGFEPLDTYAGITPDAFEAEPGTQADAHAGGQ